MSLEVFEQTSISPNGAPEILYRFDHAVRRAELSGAVLYAEMRGDRVCDHDDRLAHDIDQAQQSEIYWREKAAKRAALKNPWGAP